MNISVLDTAKISVMNLFDFPTREQYQHWVAIKGQKKEYGDTAEEAVMNLLKSLDIL